MSNETQERKAIRSLLAAMRRWGAQEDGIPDAYGIADAYDAAASIVGETLLMRDEIGEGYTLTGMMECAAHRRRVTT